MNTNDTPETASARALHGSIHRPAELTRQQRQQMAALLSQFFENTSQQQFEQDLAEKEWVFLFRQPDGTVQGFSTLMRLRLRVGQRPIVAFYSGDTIIHPDFWHELELPKIWGAHVFALAAQEPPNTEIYWFLISSGYKTYRFLPVFFRTFYPSHRQPTPPEIQQVLDALGSHRFGQQYDPASGVIRFDTPAPLRDGVAEVDPRRLKNRDIAYFVQRNPGYAQGDQLACLVRMDLANVNRAGMRMLGMAEEKQEK